MRGFQQDLAFLSQINLLCYVVKSAVTHKINCAKDLSRTKSIVTKSKYRITIRTSESILLRTGEVSTKLLRSLNKPWTKRPEEARGPDKQVLI